MVKRFENKIWLSSPTMHGDELRYVSDAYESYPEIRMKGNNRDGHEKIDFTRVLRL